MVSLHITTYEGDIREIIENYDAYTCTFSLIYTFETTLSHKQLKTHSHTQLKSYHKIRKD